MKSVLVMLVVALSAEVASAQPAPDDIARAFVAAFNERSIDGMLQLATEDVEGVSLSGTKVTVETAGKEALRKSMTAYFKSCPTCRSEIAAAIATPGRVAAIEVANWEAAAGARSQRGLRNREGTDSVDLLLPRRAAMTRQ